MIVDHISKLANYVDSTTMAKMQGFINSVYIEDSEDGTYPLGAGILAKISSYDLKEEGDCMIEAHKHHIDIQATIIGAEGISIFNQEDICDYGPYDNDTDVMFSKKAQSAPVARVINKPGSFTLIFPGEPHRPMERVPDQPIKVKKYVIKIDTDIHRL